MADTEKTPLFMPILDSVRSEFRRKGIAHPDRLPWPLFATEEARRQCKINHGQSPEELAKRGGLGIAEAIAILRGERVAEGLTDENALTKLAETIDALRANADPIVHGANVLAAVRRSQWGVALSREAARDLVMFVDSQVKDFPRVVSILRLLLDHTGGTEPETVLTTEELIKAAEADLASKAPTALELHNLLVAAQESLRELTDKDALTEPEGDAANCAREVLRNIKEAIG